MQLFVPPAHHHGTAKHLQKSRDRDVMKSAELHIISTSPAQWLFEKLQDNLPVWSYLAQDISTVASRSTCSTSDNHTRNSPKITDLRFQQTTHEQNNYRNYYTETNLKSDAPYLWDMMFFSLFQIIWLQRKQTSVLTINFFTKYTYDSDWYLLKLVQVIWLAVEIQLQ